MDFGIFVAIFGRPWLGAFQAPAAGVLVWLVMNNVIAPLGRGRPEPVGTPAFWAVLVGHVFFVGLPLVWGTRHFAPAVTDLRQPSSDAGDPSRSLASVD
ncbi:MAG TPA: hypothetical protein VF178_04510 [Gemmatimonadaceae bacterium]